MTIAQICIVVPLFCYAVAAIDFAMKGNWGMAITFCAYSIANVGLVIAARTPAN